MSFCVKSTHKFVNPPVDQDKETNYDYFTPYPASKSISIKGVTNSDPNRREDSQKGMVIRTTNTSVEDFY